MKHEQVKKSISELLAKIGYSQRDVEITYEDKLNTLWFSITSPHTRILFSRNAEPLSAINHLAGKIAEQIMREEEKHLRIVIDAGGVEKKKIDGLKTLAHMMAERARYFKSSIDIEPMSAHDRKIIHEFLSEIPDVKTESKGEGSGRHIVVTYTGGI